MTKSRGKRSGSKGASKRPPNLGEIGLNNIYREVEKQSDRGAALLGGELVNTSLQVALSFHFIRGADEDALFFRDKAPLREFSSRIKVAHAMGIFDSGVRDRLNTIRNIRNHFAHDLRPHEFDEPSIVAQCEKLPDSGPSHPQAKDWHPARHRYMADCLALCEILIDAAMQAMTRRDLQTLTQVIRSEPSTKET